MKASWKYFISALLKRATIILPHAIILLPGIIFLDVLISCNDKNKVYPEPVKFSWNFESGAEGWAGDFTDYKVGEEASFLFSFRHDTLPEPLGTGQGALMLSGYSANSDLFMYVKRRVSGLQPNTVYYATFSIQFASNLPGLESNPIAAQEIGVYLSAGVATIEPVKKVEENGNYGLNIGKSNLLQAGENMMVLGSLMNETEQPVYALKTLSNENPLHFISDENGEAWIIVGVDSGAERAVTMFINEIIVEFF